MIGLCAAAQLCAAQASGRVVSAVLLIGLLNQVQMHLTHSQMEMHQLPFDILVYSNTQSTDVMEITISAVCNAQLVIIPQKEKVVHMSTRCTCAFEHRCVHICMCAQLVALQQRHGVLWQGGHAPPDLR